MATTGIDIRCIICGGWGAINAGDEWCDHCLACHERHCVRGEPLPEAVAEHKAAAVAVLGEWLV